MTTPLRILHIITGLTVGGAQQLLLEMLPEIRDRGNEVAVVSLYSGPLTPEFVRSGIPVTELSLTGMVDPRTFLRLVGEIRRFKPDVVHTHLGKADTYGRVAARMAGVPVVVTTVHNVEDWKQNSTLRLVDGWTSKLADRLIACSGKVADHVLSLNNVNPEKVMTISNGLSLKNWPAVPVGEAPGLRAEFGFTSSDFILGTIGRMEVQKGQKFLIDALGIVRGHGCNAKVLFVGDGSLRTELEQQAADAGLKEHVVFAGMRRDAKALLSIMDMFVLPSLWEGLPIALLEAMAGHRTILVTPVGGVPEVIQDGYNGLLVPPGDAAALAQSIERCYNDKGLRTNLAAAARRTVEATFSLDVTVERVLELYQDLSARHARHTA